MKLSDIDRLIILYALLPQTGTVEQIKLIRSLKNKLQFSEEDLKSYDIRINDRNIISISNIGSSNSNRDISYDISLDEIEFLKLLATGNDANGWVTESSINTIEYLINYTIEE